MNEIPDDQDVTDESGLFDHVDFVVEPFDQFRIGPGAFAIAIMQTLVTKLAQIHFTRFSLGRRIFRILRDAELEREIAAVRDDERICDGFGVIRKQSPHFVGGLEIKLRRVMHPPFIVHHLAGADANHDVMRLVMAALQEMHVVCRHKAEAKLLR